MQKLPGKERGAAISCCIDSYQPFDGMIRAIFEDVTFKSHTDVLVFIVCFFSLGSCLCICIACIT